MAQSTSLSIGIAPADAISSLADASSRVHQSGAHWYEAELHRLYGGLLLRGDGAAGDAETSFRRALAVARDQGAKLWELRSAMSLGRFWFEQGRRDEARNLLAPVYGSFTEGADMPDLKDARALLEQLT